MRLIDADKLLEKLAYIMPQDDLYAVTVEAIRQAPTVDAVPVVRCRDCKYSVRSICCYHCVPTGFPPDSFCSFAVTKTGGNNNE